MFRNFEPMNWNLLRWPCLGYEVIYGCEIEKWFFVHFSEKFTFTDSLTIHIATVHEDKVTQVECDICNKKFPRKDTLNKHIARVHKGEKKVCPCNICGEIFSRPHSLRRHISTVHERELRENCDICGKKFTTRTSFTRHSALRRF